MKDRRTYTVLIADLRGQLYCGHHHRTIEAAGRCVGKFIRRGVPVIRLRVASSFDGSATG